MSYYTQRIANNFPLWSALRMDPSSYGFRLLNPLAELQEEDLQKSLRLKHFNKAVVSGGTVFDLPYLWYIDLTEFGKVLDSVEDAPMVIEGIYKKDFDGFGLALQDEILFPKTISEFLYDPPDDIWETDGSSGPDSAPANRTIFPPSQFPDPQPAGYVNKFNLIWAADPVDSTKYPGIPGGTFVETQIVDSQGSTKELFMPIMISADEPLLFEAGADNLAAEDRLAFQLGVTVKGSTRYRRWYDSPANTPKDYGILLPNSGHHKIILRGEDENGNDISESIYIRDDGSYLTQKRFTMLRSIDDPAGEPGDMLMPVEIEGFNGAVEISLSDARHKTKTCPWHLAIMADSDNSFAQPNATSFEYLNIDSGKPIAENATEGPLMLELSYPEDQNLPGSYLDSYFHIYTNGQSYRRPEVELEAEDDNRELLCSQFLLDQEGNPIKAVDFTFSWWDMRTWVLDDQGNLHRYKLGYQPFRAWTLPRTKTIDVEIKPLDHRAVFGESIPLWSWHRVLRRAIKRIAFIRESPAQKPLGEDLSSFAPDYLQADYSWGPEKHYFAGTDEIDLPETSWQDIKFTTDFAAIDPNNNPHNIEYKDVLGQWNFYCETILRSNKDLDIQRLEKLYQDGLVADGDYYELKEKIIHDQSEGLVTEMMHRSCTAVMCEYLEAEKSYNLNIQNPWGLYTDGTASDLCVISHEGGSWKEPAGGGLITQLHSVKHNCFLDYYSNKIFFSFPFDRIHLIWPGFDALVEPCASAVSPDFQQLDIEEKSKLLCIKDIPLANPISQQQLFGPANLTSSLEGNEVKLEWDLILGPYSLEKFLYWKAESLNPGKQIAEKLSVYVKDMIEHGFFFEDLAAFLADVPNFADDPAEYELEFQAFLLEGGNAFINMLAAADYTVDEYNDLNWEDFLAQEWLDIVLKYRVYYGPYEGGPYVSTYYEGVPSPSPFDVEFDLDDIPIPTVDPNFAKPPLPRVSTNVSGFEQGVTIYFTVTGYYDDEESKYSNEVEQLY